MAFPTSASREVEETGSSVKMHPRQPDKRFLNCRRYVL